MCVCKLRHADMVTYLITPPAAVAVAVVAGKLIYVCIHCFDES